MTTMDNAAPPNASSAAMDLLNAVRGAETDAPNDEPLSERDTTDIDLAQDSEVAEEETKQGAASPEEATEQFIELPPAEDGGEPEKVPLADAVRAVREMREIEGKVDQIYSLAEQRVAERAQAVYQQQDAQLQQMGQVLATWHQGLAAMAPKPPSMDMLNPQHASYNPDAYNMQKAQFEQINGVFGQIGQQLQAVQAEQMRIAKEKHERYLDQEEGRLYRADPSWRTDLEGKVNEIHAVMRERYGFDSETLFAIGDHRFFLAAADLVKFHKLEKGGKDAQARIAQQKGNGAARGAQPAQGARVVKPGRETPTQDARGRFVSKSAAALSDGPYTSDKGRAYFHGLIKAGKI